MTSFKTRTAEWGKYFQFVLVLTWKTEKLLNKNLLICIRCFIHYKRNIIHSINVLILTFTIWRGITGWPKCSASVVVVNCTSTSLKIKTKKRYVGILHCFYNLALYPGILVSNASAGCEVHRVVMQEPHSNVVNKVTLLRDCSLLTIHENIFWKTGWHFSVLNARN